MEKQKRWSAWLIAAVVVVVAGAAIGVGMMNSGNAQADTVLQEHEGLVRQLFPYAGEGAESFERLAIEVKDGFEMAYTVLRGGEPLGYAVKQTVQGYGGPIELIVGMRTDRTLAGIHVGGADFNETEGLGAKAKEPAFTDQFAGKSVPLTLGQDIDAIAGATVTSRAIVDGVNQAAERLHAHLDAGQTGAPTAAPSGMVAEGRTANASVIGYGGPVLVRLTLDENGTIAHIDVGGARFAETEGVGSRVREESFVSQFTGKTPPLALGKDIDAVSGATVSSQAAVDAVNDAAAFLNEK